MLGDAGILYIHSHDMIQGLENGAFVGMDNTPYSTAHGIVHIPTASVKNYLN